MDWKNFLNADGLTFHYHGYMDNGEFVSANGTIYVDNDNNEVSFCCEEGTRILLKISFDTLNGTVPADSTSSIFLNNVTVEPRHADTYKDWKPGDKIQFYGPSRLVYEIIFVSGNFIAISDSDYNVSLHDKRKFNKYAKLVLTDFEKNGDFYNYKKGDCVIYRYCKQDSWRVGYVWETFDGSSKYKIVKIIEQPAEQMTAYMESQDRFRPLTVVKDNEHIFPYSEDLWNKLRNEDKLLGKTL